MEDEKDIVDLAVEQMLELSRNFQKKQTVK